MDFITDIRLWPAKKPGKIKAMGYIVCNDAIKIQIRVVEGTKGLFVGWPNREKDGKYYDDAGPINKEVAESVNAYIVGAFENGSAIVKEDASFDHGANSSPKPVVNQTSATKKFSRPIPTT